MTLSYQNKYEVTLQFKDGGDQTLYPVRRITGLVKLKQIATLIDVLDLDANPRDSKIGSVTADIIETLEMSPDLYPIKSKGILLAASQFNELDRNRIEILFANKDLEGILDGGHNMLAIGHFLMGKALTDKAALKDLRGAKVWSEFKGVHRRFKPVFDEYLKSGAPELEIQAWMELIVPASSDEIALENFENALLDIGEARNNNAALKQETKTDKAGFYDPLKQYLDPKIAEKIEWKTNDSGKIKVADLVALAWIPLTALQIAPEGSSGKRIMPVSPIQTYSNKAACVARYHELMESDQVTVQRSGNAELRNQSVRSALELAADMPHIYDYVQANIASSYNRLGGRYGNIAAVSKKNPTLQRKAVSKYKGNQIDKNSPDGFIAPIVYSSLALIEKNLDGTVEWKLDPIEFFDKYLDNIVAKLKNFMSVPGDEDSADPQKVGKNPTVYDACFQAAENALLRDQIDKMS